MEDFSDQKYTYFVPDEDSLSQEEGQEPETKNSLDKKTSSRPKIVRKRTKTGVWLSVAEAANLGGIQGKTIRRAIKERQNLRYRIVNNKYRIELSSLVDFMHTTKKLENKFYKYGLGQYVQKWKK
ncbi:MAG TPA: hypothetical protein VKO42_00770 [Patescibacteria group bacterium]|nr:hypothetical protein [Patescibacteria group bacterium]